MPHERELYKIEQLPIFQNLMYDSEAEAKACPKGDVCLVENLATGLVYNASFRPELMLYDKHYQNEQAVSPIFKEHLQSVSGIIERKIGKDGLVEVGCGKGYFLEMLLNRGFDVIGFDPTYEGTNPRIEKCFFEAKAGVKAKGLILRHVLEHIQNPLGFLMSLRESNGGKGLIYIEVPCFDWICSQRAWFDVYYEHVNYFRRSDFHRMFDNVLESGRFFEGQYLYVVAELTSIKEPEYDERLRVDFPQDFLPIPEVGHGKEKNYVLTAVWGGASKGVIFTLFMSRIGQPVDMVIDINPAKQGKYLPATGMRVYSPAEALKVLPKGSTIFVMNSNYLEEVKKMSNNSYRYVSVDRE